MKLGHSSGHTVFILYPTRDIKNRFSTHLVHHIIRNKLSRNVSCTFSLYTRCPNKNATFLTKHETIAFCSIAEILFDSKRVSINLDFETLASHICKIFFETPKSEDINVFSKTRFQAILGISILRTSLHYSALEMPKMVHLCQEAYPKKLQ